MKWIQILVIACLASCASSQDLDQLQKTVDLCHRVLMEGEQELVGTYFEIEEFHAAMLWEVKDKELDPYPDLILLKDTMMQLKDVVITQRGDSYQENVAIAKKQISKGSFDKAKQEMLQRSETEIERLAVHNRVFFSFKSDYDSLLQLHGIRRITHALYSDSLLRRLHRWQDSLVVQGSAIAKCKQVLKNSGFGSNSEVYRSNYRYVSEMEALHKKLQAKLTQIENQQSRYDSSRQDEYYYIGPQMVERHDVNSTENDFEEIGLNMELFRDQEELFVNASW
jgi:hypothetical protein